MENMEFKCPYCGQINEGDSSLAGTEAECVSCGKTFMLGPNVGANVKQNVRLGISWYARMFKQYFKFGGRAGRREFWMVFLCEVVIALALFVFAVIIEADFDLGDFISNIGYAKYRLLKLFGAASAIPFVALTMRRLHDTDKSGWWIFLLVVPIVNIALIVWLATTGDPAANRFGLPPEN